MCKQSHNKLAGCVTRGISCIDTPCPPSSYLLPPHRKRKKVVEELSDDEDHGDFDPQQLREHEEFTKVSVCVSRVCV